MAEREGFVAFQVGHPFLFLLFIGIKFCIRKNLLSNPHVYIKMAEREGFEPSEPVKVHTLSRGARSATLPPFLKKYYFGFKLKKMAEKQRFELWVPCDTTVFKTVALNHSAISPRIILFFILKNKFNMAPPVGFEPTTKRLTVVYSTAELWRKIYIQFNEKDIIFFLFFVKVFYSFFNKLMLRSILMALNKENFPLFYIHLQV